MLKAEYHERIEQAMWRRARDKRVPAWWRWRLRLQAKRFRVLAKWSRRIEGKDEPTTEIIGHIARQLLVSPVEARKIVVGDGWAGVLEALQNSDPSPLRPRNHQSSKATESATWTTEGVAKSVDHTFDEETWAQAKPRFIEAMQELRLAENDIGQFPIRLAGNLRDNYSFTNESFEAMNPYLMHFLKEVREGKIKITAQRKS